MVGLGLGLLFGLVVMSGVVLGAGLVVLLDRKRGTVIPFLLAFAAGTLLGSALLALVPEAATRLPLVSVGGLMLLAILMFFLLERWTLWRHCHEDQCDVHRAAGYLILVGDGLHNTVDGLALGAAFAASPWLGMTVGLAALAHEVPQEVGDFALLVESGFSRRRALLYNLASALPLLPGVTVGYLVAEAVEPFMAVLLALAAGGFLYVALADLVPHLHERARGRWPGHAVLPLLAGVALVWLLGQLER